MDQKLLARYAVRETLGLGIMAAALFWPAGRLDWPEGWAVVAVTAAWVVGMAYVMLRWNPSLIAERLGPRKGSKAWDTAILGALGLLQLAQYTLAGFDRRNGWSGDFSTVVQIAALLVCILGQGLMLWAMAANAFFSQVVRLQTERGHRVVTGGPYRFVRHPGYLGSAAYELAVSFLLESWPALVIGVVATGLLALRTALEDRTLQSELPGYSDYARRTRFKLLPGVW